MTDLPRIAVWGLGRHAITNILPVLSDMEELSLYGVCSRTKPVVDDCAKQFDCLGWIDPVMMLANQSIDIVYLATPIGLHASQGRQVLEAGKHLWCEKPLTCDLADTEMLIQLSRKKRLTLAEGFMYLDHPQFARVARFVQDKEMGTVKTVNCRFGIPTLENPGFRNDPTLGGGAFWDVGSYTVSAALALFPEQEVQVLYADKRNHKKDVIDSEGRVILRFFDGTIALLDWCIGCSYRNELDIWSEQGSLFTEKIFSKPAGYAPILKLRSLNGVEHTESVDTGNHFVNMFRRFCRMLVDRKVAHQEQQRILRLANLLDDVLRQTQNIN